MTFLSYSDVPVRVLEACDSALERAVNSRMKERDDTDQEFDNAIRKLYAYEKDFHPG
jgi:hypothetical protein